MIIVAVRLRPGRVNRNKLCLLKGSIGDFSINSDRGLATRGRK